MNHTKIYSIAKGKKTSPLPYLHKGWQIKNEKALFMPQLSAKADLLIDLCPGANIFFMAEVAFGEKLPPTHPLKIKISVNTHFIDEWTLNSEIIHDKLILIPAQFIQDANPHTISFEIPGDAHKSCNRSIEFQSIAVATDLDAYLKELQTGYDWSCNVRKEFIDTAEQVVSFFKNTTTRHHRIEEKLLSFLQNPYALSEHDLPISFDENYFFANFAELKEGHIHNEIRTWVSSIKNLHSLVIEAGNYASKNQTPTDGNNNLLHKIKSHCADIEKISTLRHLNIKLNNLEILLKKETLSSVPSSLYLDITNNCNFRCKMCYQSQSHFLRTNLQNAHLHVILQMLPYLEDITVAGLGEPLLSTNLKILAQAAQKLQSKICLITNGSLIHKHLDALKHFSKVSISFDSAQAEVFEALRQRSRFSQIIKNIQLLRQQAPDLLIAFSVVISRINLDEIEQIAQIAGELGVNEIHMTPMEHMSLLKLKLSDIPLFKDQLEAAERLAHKYNMTINNSIVDASFSKHQDMPRDKAKLLRHIASLPTQQEQSSNINEIEINLLNQHFHYHPAPVVFSLDKLPDAPGPINKKYSNPPEAHLFQMLIDLNFEIEKFSTKIEELLQEVARHPDDRFALPYCLDPWKLNYVKSNGKNRLCCHADIITGNIGADGFRQSINSEKYQIIRASMFNRRNMLPECQRCKAADRFMGLQSLQELSHRLGLAMVTGQEYTHE